jgi:hypothetical protein
MSASRRTQSFVEPTCDADVMPEPREAPPIPEPVPPPPPGQPHRRVESLDGYFAGLYDQSLGHLANDLPQAPPGVPSQPAPEMAPEPDVDPRAQFEWLAEERQRLESFMGKQFGLLKRQRFELAAFRSQVEANLMAREQEINRQEKLLTARREALQQREQNLTHFEANLSVQNEKLATVSAEVQALQETRERVRQDIELLCGRLEQIRVDSEQMQRDKCTAQNDMAALAELRVVQQRKWQAEQSEWANRRRQMEQRALELEKSEKSLQIRSGEMDDLEHQIRQELEKHEQRLILDKQDLESRQEQFLTDQQEKDFLRAKLGAQSQEVERLRKRLLGQNDEIEKLRAELGRQSEQAPNKAGGSKNKPNLQQATSYLWPS